MSSHRSVSFFCGRSVSDAIEEAGRENGGAASEWAELVEGSQVVRGPMELLQESFGAEKDR
jgi:membrane protease subunit (stomatin/prohibitin family)